MTDPARLFAVGLGQDYPESLVAGLAARLPADDPVAWARTTIFASSGRMLRRIRAVFDAGPPRLIPRMRLLTDLPVAATGPEIPPALKPLELKLDLAELILSLMERGLVAAPRTAAFDLAEQLAALLDEIHGEGVDPARLAALDLGDFAEHWKQGRTILDAAMSLFADRSDNLPGTEARRRRIVAQLAESWRTVPPAGPIVIAGSTGSRGATRLLMNAVARLPEGYVVLPGFDFDQPDAVWQRLDRDTPQEDHPQYRFAALMTALDLSPTAVQPWHESLAADAARNRLVSLALRPAPVTDQWRREGRRLGDLAAATAGISLIEAPGPRAEAAAIALRLRRAVADGQVAALICPDRMLTRRVAATLQRWEIEPDDSAGEPLHQTAPGRFLRHVAALLEAEPDLPGLLVLLKHPLTASTESTRGPHLRWTRELELYLRGNSEARPGARALLEWGSRGAVQDGRGDWAGWLASLLDGVARPDRAGLGHRVAAHFALAERLSAGCGAAGSGALWTQRSGEAAAAAMQDLVSAGDRGGDITARDYSTLLVNHLSGVNVQEPTRPHPGVMIWGTLEARAGGADLTILAGLTDGTWPGLPAPDAWLNRKMRAEAGLLSPERSIGLSAHDFQQAIAAPEVVLSRSLRDAEAETVPSRWLNRLTNLLGGLGEEGTAALEAMQARGKTLLDLAARLDQPERRCDPEPRPKPCPPVSARPRQLSVTRITQLVRDPYAIYARHILRLRRLEPLAPAADARLRGTVLHRIMEDFIAAREEWRDSPDAARACLADRAAERLAQDVPQPAMRALWRARLMAVADRLIAGEIGRLSAGDPVLIEERGRLELADLDFTLVARPDRIDRRRDGSYAIYDYKSGQPPSYKQVLHFEKQLPLEAAMLERGAFAGLSPGVVAELGYIAIGASGQDRPIDTETDAGQLADVTLDGLRRLIARYRRPTQGYTAIRAAETTRFSGDYDQLARYGEWDLTQAAVPIRVGREEEA
ncbi:double-strand break repair protein AddB [Tropicimonas sp. IMCC6043]|uniref:double-strand break repair protein AddB n=1 Tax=Tropicimonas sp. IMCC6043 TaxID=2510645 RepID=UPI00101C7777|nr:double-strand break repair protein AddB [Tropicimonas sp. IMCC6043]RYH10891.1 double-strand break repair protein AddB [Tropicimonas sp. IMCC6043]